MDAYNFNSAKDNTATSTSGLNYSFCGDCLPCGVCRMLNVMCPLGYNAPTITRTYGDGLYNPQAGPTCTTQSGTTNQNIKETMNTEKE